MPIKIPIVADVANAVAGVKDVGKEFDKSADSLDKFIDTSKDAEKALDWGTPDSLEKVDDGVKDAAQGMERLEDKADSAGDTLERKFRDAADSVSKLDDAGKNVKDIDVEIDIDTDKPLTKVQDLGNEIKATLGETMGELAGTFAQNGFNMEDAFDGILEVSSETASLIPGPWSLAAQAVIVALAGLVGESKKTQEEIAAEAEEKAERYESAYKTAFENITSAGAAMGEELVISSNVNDILVDTERLNEATKTSNDLGVERGTVLRAMAGDEAAFQEVQKEGNSIIEQTSERYDELANKMLYQGGLTQAEQSEYDNLLDKRSAARDGLDATTDAYGTNSDAIAAATDAAREKARQDDISAAKQIDVAKGLARTSNEAEHLEVTIDGVTRSLKVMPNGKVIDVTDDGTAHLTQKQINNIDGKNVSVAVSASTAMADNAVANFRHRASSIPVTLQLRAV